MLRDYGERSLNKYKYIRFNVIRAILQENNRQIYKNKE